MNHSTKVEATPEMYAAVQGRYAVEKGSIEGLMRAAVEHLGWDEFAAQMADSHQLVFALFQHMNKSIDQIT